MDYSCGSKCAIEYVDGRVSGTGCFFAGIFGIIGNTDLVGKFVDGWYIFDSELGGFGDVATNGNFFPVVYVIGRFWAVAKCNAAGVTSCRIIHSPRERMIAILTNNFVPCNGRFPTIILLSSIFLSAGMPWLSGFAVFFVVGLSVGLTLLVSFVLNQTLV